MLTDDFKQFSEELLEAVTSIKRFTSSNSGDWHLKKENFIQSAYITNELTLKVEVNEKLFPVDELYRSGYLIYSLDNGHFLAYELSDGNWTKEIPVGLNWVNMRVEDLVKKMKSSKSQT